MIEPYVFVRAITFGLGLLWACFWIARIVRFERRWRSRAVTVLHVDERRWRRWIATIFLRATILDPVNLGLMCVLLAIWTLYRVQ